MACGVPYECRWGILATGWIASVFAKDLLIDPSTRGVSDVTHTVAAAASSTSVARARKFLTEIGAPTAAAYGSYEELVADPDVDVVYIATPHSHHFENCLLVLRAGKNIVCEKPFTVNAAQLKILVALAREKKVFMMEAVWTRFFPLSIEVREVIKSGVLGDVRRVAAELNLAQDPDETYADGKHRMVNPSLAGGALLDLGIYSLTWVYQCLYHTLPEAEKAKSAPSVIGTISRFAPTGVDAENVVVVTFPHSIGIASSSIRVATDPDNTGRPAIRISGTKGEIQVAHPAYRPESFIIIKDKKAEERKFPIPAGHGMFWEADGAARALRDGQFECEMMPLSESILTMEAMDKVRYDNGFKYPEALERTDY